MFDASSFSTIPVVLPTHIPPSSPVHSIFDKSSAAPKKNDAVDLARARGESLRAAAKAHKTAPAADAHQASSSNSHGLDLTKHTLQRKTGLHTEEHELTHLRKANPTEYKNLSNENIEVMLETINEIRDKLPLGHSLTLAHKKAIMHTLRHTHGFSKEDLHDVRGFLHLS